MLTYVSNIMIIPYKEENRNKHVLTKFDKIDILTYC